ncbi:MAG TPA: trypsin-like peptidase domain-containing protein [Pyrinomonadaceae bacterium]|jgi:serine protease Do|nr:trypsin-like peptidase domain-containing protein [Pyrinomonadaceae bacterium]
MMFESLNQTTENEKLILRKLRVWIAALAAVCVLGGIGIGAILAGRNAVAQNGSQLSRAPEALSASFVEIARSVEPAVVNIDTMQTADLETDNEDRTDRPANPLDMFRRQQPRPTHGVGSGFIIDPKGFILTNNHVIEGATKITIGMLSGDRYRAKVIGIDRETDLAVLKIDAERELPVMKFGDSNAAEVGDWVLAIGSPFGLEQTVTAGIISKKDRDTTNSSFQRFLQTDAAINRGNSGGPLVNMRGEAIGVNSQIATLTGDYNGIGFALPANEAKFVAEQILGRGRVQRGFLGVTLESVRAEFARVYHLPDAKGAIVADIQPERNGQPTPAAKAGLQVNDIITEFNGQVVRDSNDLIAKVAGTSVGQTVSLTVLRDVDGKLDKRTVTATLGDRSDYLQDVDASARDKSDSPKSNSVRLGLTLAELTPQLIADKHLDGLKGLYVKDVDPNGLAAEVRPNEVQVGEVITRVNRIPVTTLAEFQRVIDSLKPGDAVVLNLSSYFRREGRLASRIVQFTYQ